MDKKKSPWDYVISNNYYDQFIINKINKIKKFNINYEIDLKNFESTINDVFHYIDNHQYKNVLLFGFIQSGKTDFIIGIITKMHSNNKQSIILSVNQPLNDLLNQTINRTKEIYDTNVFDFKGIKENFYEIKNKIKKGENVTFFLLKNVKHLKQFNNLLEELKKENISFNKSLIIDDEGDATGLNDISKDDPSEVFSHLTLIKKNLNANYLSITATPFAHFLLDKKDGLKPDYSYMLSPSSGYTGLNYFIKTYNEGVNINFIKINKITKDEYDELIINPDYQKAIKTYIVQCFWWTYIFKNEYKPKMLVNIAKRKLVHGQIYSETKNLLKKIKQEYSRKSDYFNDVFNDLNIDLSNEPLFNQHFQEIINNIDAFILNGNSKKQTINLDGHEKIKYYIIIGQTKLDRGLTIIDLINTFISSRSNNHPNADSILQQARFIGYRDEYKEKIRVFLIEDLINDYINIEENLQYFQTIINDNHDFAKIENFVPIDNDNNLYPTRKTVANVEYINGNKKIDIINNQYFRNSDNDLNAFNEKFFQQTNKLENNGFDSQNNKIYIFEEYKDFCKTYDIKTTYPALQEYFYRLSAKDEQDINIIQKIFNENGKFKIIVRILKTNNRIITENKKNKYDTIGKGTYASNDQEFLLKDNVLSIDIIPINTYYKSNYNDKNLVYRTRIFIPKQLLQQKGFIS